MQIVNKCDILNRHSFEFCRSVNCIKYEKGIAMFGIFGKKKTRVQGKVRE